MNKAQLVQEIQNNLGDGATKAAAERALEAVTTSIKKGVVEDNSVQLVGFGTFSVSERAARKGVNPQTGENIQIAASKSVKFKPSSQFKEMLS